MKTAPLRWTVGLAANKFGVDRRPVATLNVHEMRRQSIYAFFQEDSTLDYLPAWQRELLRYERDQE